MIVLLIEEDYELRLNSWCSPDICNGMNLSEAKHKCRANSSCDMFYDMGGAGTIFCFCDDDFLPTSSFGDILYTKKREYTRICTSTCKAIRW